MVNESMVGALLAFTCTVFWQVFVCEYWSVAVTTAVYSPAEL